MAIDYSQRPAGMSKREYAASILGGSKSDYDSSGNKTSSSGGSFGTTYTPKEYKWKDLVDTKPVEEAFSSARGTYVEQLSALKPRYEELYKQLQAQEELSAEKEQAQFADEKTQQKVDLARRGVSTDSSNPFYAKEADKLTKEQNIQSRETSLAYAGKRLDISGAESADERDINTAIANLDLGKANSITGMINSAKALAANLNSAEADRALQAAQWNKTFEYTQSEDAANRALELYKLAKTETSSKNEAYNSTLASLVTSAYNQDNPPAYTRERIAKQMKAAYPELASQVDTDINKFFPNGWEAGASGGNDTLKIKTDENGRAYIDTE